MTFREQYKIDHPYDNDIVGKGCPYDHGYEHGRPADCTSDNKNFTCSDCWNREMPGTTEQVKSSIKDSGDRTEFKSGAVRDMHEGKGRCDLMPLDVVGDILNNAVFNSIYNFQKTGDIRNLRIALLSCGLFSDIPDSSANYMHTMFLEVAKHFEEGCKKYGENNWRKGIPVKCYIDSAVRHYLKHLRGDKDEPHDRAFCWNILCCIWTVNNIPGALEESGYGTSI